ncbi:hypothetical protein IMY05_C4667000500 [Salix suchowensis]|nr:hypothetical protein IMY05_C4667000500 [Salix suchowensis]
MPELIAMTQRITVKTAIEAGDIADTVERDGTPFPTVSTSIHRHEATTQSTGSDTLPDTTINVTFPRTPGAAAGTFLDLSDGSNEITPTSGKAHSIGGLPVRARTLVDRKRECLRVPEPKRTDHDGKPRRRDKADEGQRDRGERPRMLPCVSRIFSRSFVLSQPRPSQDEVVPRHRRLDDEEYLFSSLTPPSALPPVYAQSYATSEPYIHRTGMGFSGMGLGLGSGVYGNPEVAIGPRPTSSAGYRESRELFRNDVEDPLEASLRHASMAARSRKDRFALSRVWRRKRESAPGSPSSLHMSDRERAWERYAGP